MNKNIKTYSGQALAIIMVVLVVSSIIGFSVYTRSIRDKRSAIQERDSAEAYEVVDVLLDTMLEYTPEQWLTTGGMVKNTEYTYPDSGDPLQDILTNLSTEVDLATFQSCKPTTDNGNKFTLKLTDGDENTEYQVQPGQAFTFVVPEGMAVPAGCKINVNFKAAAPETGFMYNHILRTQPTSTEIIPYDYDHAETYCLNNNCNTFSRGVPPIVNNKTTLTIDADTLQYLDRAQIIAINNVVTFTYTTEQPACGDLFNSTVLRASAICNGIYRAKEVIVPKYRSHYSIFNYVLFNGNGEMNSNL